MRVYQGDPTKLAADSPALSTDLLAYVAQTYGFDIADAEKLGGSWNLNVRADLVTGERCVIRVYGPWVTAARVHELQRIRRILDEKGLPTPQLQPTTDGTFSTLFEGSVVEVETYVDGTPMQTWQQLCTGMRTLAKLHTHMAALDCEIPPPVANHLPEELALAATEDVLRVIEAWDPTPQEQRFAAAVAELVQMLPVVELPVQLVHGDFKDNNLVFRENKLAAVLDFDFMGVRPRIDDLALPLHTLLQRGMPLRDVQRLVDLYDAGCAVPLSQQERRALPHAMARMALCYLQYMLIPGDEAYQLHCRREFNENRGPACVWWLEQLRNRRFREDGFMNRTTTLCH
ncbi:MAG TPA: phosphotransferase [Caldilineaceae bacterium]|nr:phosphotransferase [Caldilineaceae bacterium]